MQEFVPNAYDKYLINEYKKFGDGDYLLTDIGDKTFVVPYKYTVDAKDGKEAVERFKNALFDFQKEEERKYKDAGELPLILNIYGRDYVVPKELSEAKFISPEYIRHDAFSKAYVKYNAVIKAHKKLTAKNMDKQPADFSSAALRKYLYRVESTKDVDKNSIKRRAKLGLLVVAAAFLGYRVTHKTTEIVKDEMYMVPEDTTKTYTDFKGKVYSDTLGNLKLMEQLKPEIMAILVGLEGYADEAFLEGGKNPTVGRGRTVKIEKDGSLTKVKLGDKVTPEEDVDRCWDYVQNEFASILGDSVGRRLLPTEILACIGSGYCWGTEAFVKSNFFKSVKDGEPLEEQQRKLSGFRKPIGLLKRAFLVAQVLGGNWTAKDILDMPIYYLKDFNAYLHCGIYPPNLYNYMPCKKDKKGNYIQDARGNYLPKIAKDDYCVKFYNDDDKQILNNKIIDVAKRGKAHYKLVRDFMPEDMVDSIEKSKPDFKLDFENSKMFMAQAYRFKKEKGEK